MRAVRRLLTSDMHDLSERDKANLVLTYLAGASFTGFTWAALILTGVLRGPTWLGLCNQVGGVLSAYPLVKLAWRRR
jgi:hypothetical protein